MNAINLKDVSKIFVGTGSSHTAVSSIWVGANKVWPTLSKPVITDTSFIWAGLSTVEPGYYIDFSWSSDWAVEYDIYVNNVMVEQRLQDTFYEYGPLSYNATPSVYVVG